MAARCTYYPLDLPRGKGESSLRRVMQRKYRFQYWDSIGEPRGSAVSVVNASTYSRWCCNCRPLSSLCCLVRLLLLSLLFCACAGPASGSDANGNAHAAALSAAKIHKDINREADDDGVVPLQRRGPRHGQGAPFSLLSPPLPLPFLLLLSHLPLFPGTHAYQLHPICSASTAVWAVLMPNRVAGSMESMDAHESVPVAVVAGNAIAPDDDFFAAPSAGTPAAV